jgi:predicted nucleic acid-binding protein
MVTASDSNLFLDIISGTPLYAVQAKRAARVIALNGPIVCYCELARNFRSSAELDGFLDGYDARVEGIDTEVAFLAGQYHKDYRQRGGTRDRVIADFLVAAHARLRADRLITRDKRFFGAHFPGLVAVNPAEL